MNGPAAAPIILLLRRSWSASITSYRHCREKKLGARPQPTCAFVMLDDHYSAEVMRSVA
ncbi:MAG: hypothetical protein MJE77_18990 [Proteobacteria bacterium]|nr:hypothetical protein [Pseudomonadota bacterium]